MSDDIRMLRRVLAGMERGQGRRYPTEIRRQIGRAARTRRRRGDSWQAIAAVIGIPHETVRRFSASADEPEDGTGKFVPIEVGPAAPSRGGLVLATPSGLRIEGLDLDSAAELLRRLT